MASAYSTKQHSLNGDHSLLVRNHLLVDEKCPKGHVTSRQGVVKPREAYQSLADTKLTSTDQSLSLLAYGQEGWFWGGSGASWVSEVDPNINNGKLEHSILFLTLSDLH